MACGKFVVPELTVIMAPFFHSGLFFQALTSATILNHAISCMIQGGSGRESWEEATWHILWRTVGETLG